MTLEVLDPTYGDDRIEFAPAPRLPSLEGAIVGVISNGKQGTRPFFDALAAELTDSYGVAEVVRVAKTNYSAPADAEIIDQAKEWNALVAGVGD